IIMKYPGFDTFVDMQFLNKGTDDEVLDIIADSIDQIFQKEDVYDKSTTSKKEFKDFVEGLTKEQFQNIYKFFETMPRLSYEFDVKNPKTGVTSSYVIEGLSSFFG
ncbi:MAG: baseplate protein, partial [Candidatus Nanopelagicaceae bacterium]